MKLVPKKGVSAKAWLDVVASALLIAIVCIVAAYIYVRRRTVQEDFAFADGKKVCNQRFFYEIDSFLSPEQCDSLITLTKQKGMQESRVGEETHELDTTVRRSTQAWFAHHENDVVKYIKDKVLSIITSVEMASCFPYTDNKKSFEDVQVVCYEASGKYDPHFDGTECGEDLNVACYPNQRLATFLIYLNDDFEGGETRFPNINDSKVKPKKGKALFFWVSDPTNRLVYEETLHGGDPVITGQKWIATQWIRSY
jgi:prolyl 4-hydroxylase